MQLSHSPKTSDRFGRYYTGSNIASLLINAMGIDNPPLVVDLGAGSGALVGEASLHWNHTKFVTVDIDKSAQSANFPGTKGTSFSHHVVDALDRSLAEKIGLKYGQVDSGLCNPPYVRPKWQKQFAEILEDAGLSHVIPRIGCVPADVLFIAQNLRLLRSGGKLGLILPDGVIAGEKYSKLRKSLATVHTLERVIELPRRVFKKTDAKAHIVVLSKNAASNDDIQVQKLFDDGYLSSSIALPPDRASARLDYSFLVSNASNICASRGDALRDVITFIRRGSHSSSELKELSYPVFHTTDFADGSINIPRRFNLGKSYIGSAGEVLAKQGDILVARVGRNLHKKIGLVSQGVIAVSDCVLVVRVATEHRKRVIDFLTSDRGRAALQATSHGVGASFITTESLLNLKI